MIGEIAALTAAFLWALSSVVYGFLGQKIPPLQLNFFKGIIATILILLTLGVQSKFTYVAPLPLALLALSGIVGIGLGDTAYFFAINKIGARKTLVLETLSPPLGALLAFIFIGEIISTVAWCGIFLTLLGVIWVISEQTVESDRLTRNSGIIWAISAAVAQAVGAVLSRFALLESDISPLQSSLIRIAAGSAIALILTQIPAFSTTQTITKTLKSFSGRTVGIIFLAAMASTYLGIWLQQTSLKFAPTGIAQTLLATSPIFIIPITLIMGEKVTWRSFLGVLIAVAGISLLFIRSS